MKKITIKTHPIESFTRVFTDKELQLEDEFSQDTIDLDAVREHIEMYYLPGFTIKEIEVTNAL